jgi:pyruvate formate lyase activating enzyme
MPGEVGICGVRRNLGGALYAESYEEVSRLDPEPVERLPLYHFRPGTSALAIGAPGESFPPEVAPPSQPLAGDTRPVELHEVVDIAVGRGIPALAYAGGEPFMWFEQMRDLCERARAEGLANLLVTNGYAREARIERLIDAANVLLLGPARVYEQRADAERDHVLATVDAFRAAGVHLEATFVVLAGVNDDEASVAETAALVAERFGEAAPLHVASPLDPETAAPVQTMLRVHGALATRLPFVYLSDVYAREANNTVCRRCGALLVDRQHARVATPGLAADGRCASCGAHNSFRIS